MSGDHDIEKRLSRRRNSSSLPFYTYNSVIQQRSSVAQMHTQRICTRGCISGWKLDTHRKDKEREGRNALKANFYEVFPIFKVERGNKIPKKS